MHNVSRRQLLGSITATGATIATAGCVEEDEQAKPQSNIVTNGDQTELGCVKSVETTGYEDGSFFLVNSIELTVELADGHGYGMASVEWSPEDTDSFEESDSKEYEQAMKTIERDADSVSFEITGPPKFVHLTTHCDADDETKLIVEVGEDVDSKPASGNESTNTSENTSEGETDA